MPSKAALTRAWGRAKTAFLKTKKDQGYGPDLALTEWRKERNRLKAANVNFPNIKDYLRPILPAVEAAEFDQLSDDQINQLFAEDVFADTGEPATGAAGAGGAAHGNRDEPGPSGTARKRPGPGGSEGENSAVPPKKTNMATGGRQGDEAHMETGDTGETGGGVGQPGAMGGQRHGETDTTGGNGGGLAGAGNNMFFDRFGQFSKDPCPDTYKYTRTYRRAFCTNTFFPNGSDANEAAIGPLLSTKDVTAAEAAGFPSKFRKMAFTHRGICIPYLWVEASMQPCDWNVPPDHLAYRVKRIGFNCPNMKLSVYNNDRTEVTQVAPAPPSDARLWQFIDTDNEYGVPQSYNVNDMAHNKMFTKEDFVDGNIDDYKMPIMGIRTLFLTDRQAKAIVNGDRRWGYTALPSGDWAAAAADANAAFNLKKHKNYKEFTLNNSKFGMSYVPNAPIVRLPHKENTNITMTVRQPMIENPDNYFQMNSSDWCTQWKFNSCYLSENLAVAPYDDLTLGEVNYYQEGESAYFQTVVDTDPLAADQQRMHNIWKAEQVRPAPNSAISQDYMKSVVRTTGRGNIDDSGRQKKRAWLTEHQCS